MEDFSRSERKQSLSTLGQRSVRSRFALRRGAEGRRVSALPSVTDLARELCAQRGLDVRLHCALPSGGTIVSVEALTFDKALVLLRLISNARVYADRWSCADSPLTQALSVRTCSSLLGTRLRESLANDLASGKVAILDARLTSGLRSAGPGRAPVQRMYVDLSAPPSVDVLTEI